MKNFIKCSFIDCPRYNYKQITSKRMYILLYQVCKYETGICLYMALADNVVITKLRHWCQKSLLTSHKHFRLRTIQVSYNNIICNSVEHVEFCAWKLRFANSIDFLSPFEENCCRIASNACRSLRWACSW